MEKKADELLREVYIEHGKQLPLVYKWVSEKARLNEFYYCLLQRISGRDAVEIKNIVQSLSSLNLLDTTSLAEATIVGGRGGRGDKLASLITDVLVENGLEREQAGVCTLAVCEAAKGIQTLHGGKLQRLLRKHGELIVEEMGKMFTISRLTEKDKRHFLTHWLQNAFEMPVPLADEYVERFCSANGITVVDLMRAADEYDLNVAVVDDLVKFHVLGECA